MHQTRSAIVAKLRKLLLVGEFTNTHYRETRCSVTASDHTKPIGDCTTSATAESYCNAHVSLWEERTIYNVYKQSDTSKCLHNADMYISLTDRPSMHAHDHIPMQTMKCKMQHIYDCPTCFARSAFVHEGLHNVLVESNASIKLHHAVYLHTLGRLEL